MAEFWEKVKRIRFRQAVTSATGAVTIYLLLVMIPMMSIAVTLIEASRLQGAAESMKEIIDVSAYAALADYDEFVDERFGLLCTSQESTPDALFADYLNTNVKTIGKSVTVGDATAEGDYALSDADILRHQILESAGISVPTEAEYNDFDMNDVMDNVLNATQGAPAVPGGGGGGGYGGGMYFGPIVGVIELADAVTKQQILYDNALNGGIGGSDLYAATGVSDEAASLITKMNAVVTSANGKKAVIRNGISGLPIEELHAMTTVLALHIDASNFLKEVKQKAEEIQPKVNQYKALPERDRLDKLITYGYGAYNMPNRTNCLQGNSLWGYAYKDAFDAAGGSAASYHNMGGKISNGTSIGTSGGSGGFKGAALEYLAVGAGSEQYNQAYAFYDLLCLRMALNYNPVMSKCSSIASKSGPGKTIAFATLLITESYYDVMLLLSGKDVPVFKESLYVTSGTGQGNLNAKADGVYGISGIRGYAQTVCGGGFPAGSAAGSGLTPDRNDPRESVSDSPITYNEYLMLYMILYGSEQQYMARLQNLIQAEAKKAHAGEYAFSLEQAYTYINTDVDYSLNPLFGLNGLSGGTGAFPAHRQQWFGY